MGWDWSSCLRIPWGGEEQLSGASPFLNFPSLAAWDAVGGEFEHPGLSNLKEFLWISVRAGDGEWQSQSSLRSLPARELQEAPDRPESFFIPCKKIFPSWILGVVQPP